MRITQRVARRLPTEPDVLELDVNDPEQLEAVAKELDGRWGRLDGLVHAIAFVPGDALGGNFLTAPSASAIAAFETSAFSLKALAAALLPLLEQAEAPAARSSASTSTPRSPGPPTTGRACRRPRSRRSAATSRATSGPRGVRANLVAAGPLTTVAASNIDGFDVLAEAWQRQAPLGWDMSDPSRSPTPASSCSRRWPARSRARSSTSTAASTPSGRRPRMRARPTRPEPSDDVECGLAPPAPQRARGRGADAAEERRVAAPTARRG